MANAFATQIIQDGPRNVIAKVTGILDTSDLALTTAINVSNLTEGSTALAPTKVRIDFLDYSISDQLEVQLLWDATTPVVIMPLAGRGKLIFQNFGGIQNNAGAGITGNILIKTTGWTSGTQVFTVTLELVKQ